MIVIGIHGKARSGKDTLAEFLINHFRDKYDQLFFKNAFADELKRMCQKEFDLSNEQLWGDEKEEPDKRYYKPISPNSCGLGLSKLPSRYWTAREIMQEVGAFYRKIDYNFWLRKIETYVNLLKKLKEDPIKPGVVNGVIITDVRYKNESDYIKKNGILIKIIRDDRAGVHGSDHASETNLDDLPDDYFDIHVINNEGLKELSVAAEESSIMIINLVKLMKKGRKV
jgi:hypothetical protein